MTRRDFLKLLAVSGVALASPKMFNEMQNVALSASFYSEGEIRNLRIINRAVTKEEVSALANEVKETTYVINIKDDDISIFKNNTKLNSENIKIDAKILVDIINKKLKGSVNINKYVKV